MRRRRRRPWPSGGGRHAEIEREQVRGRPGARGIGSSVQDVRAGTAVRRARVRDAPVHLQRRELLLAASGQGFAQDAREARRARRYGRCEPGPKVRTRRWYCRRRTPKAPGTPFLRSLALDQDYEMDVTDMGLTGMVFSVISIAIGAVMYWAVTS